MPTELIASAYHRLIRLYVLPVAIEELHHNILAIGRDLFACAVREEYLSRTSAVIAYTQSVMCCIFNLYCLIASIEYIAISLK